MENQEAKSFSDLEMRALKNSINFVRNLVTVLSVNGKKIGKKDIDEIYKNILGAELAENQ